MIIENTAPQTDQPVENTRYKQVKISVDPVIASAFKKACLNSDTSMAATISRFMSDFSKIVASRESPPDYSTRRCRRKAIQTIVKQLEQIRSFEEQYQERIPENLQGSVVYDRAEEFISSLGETIDILTSI